MKRRSEQLQHRIIEPRDEFANVAPIGLGHSRRSRHCAGDPLVAHEFAVVHLLDVGPAILVPALVGAPATAAEDGESTAHREDDEKVDD
jgi:hypothetical protein